MSDIIFNVPPRRESVRINLSVSEETYKQLLIIQYKIDATMAQVVEMLMSASLPEYFNQFPLNDGEEEELFLEAEGEKNRRCYYTNCVDKYSYHKQKNMLYSNGKYFCSQRCLDYFNGINEGKLGKDRCSICSVYLNKDNVASDLYQGRLICLSCRSQGKANKSNETKTFDLQRLVGKTELRYCQNAQCPNKGEKFQTQSMIEDGAFLYCSEECLEAARTNR